MKINTIEREGIIILTLDGEMVGGPDATALSERLYDFIEQGKTRIAVNMEKVTWMNSSGLGILIGSLTTIRNHGGDLKLFQIGKKPSHLLKITQLDRVFDILETEEEAIASFLQ